MKRSPVLGYIIPFNWPLSGAKTIKYYKDKGLNQAGKTSTIKQIYGAIILIYAAFPFP
jgi:hypothetical protein